MHGIDVIFDPIGDRYSEAALRAIARDGLGEDRENKVIGGAESGTENGPSRGGALFEGDAAFLHAVVAVTHRLHIVEFAD